MSKLRIVVFDVPFQLPCGAGFHIAHRACETLHFVVPFQMRFQSVFGGKLHWTLLAREFATMMRQSVRIQLRFSHKSLSALIANESLDGRFRVRISAVMLSQMQFDALHICEGLFAKFALIGRSDRSGLWSIELIFCNKHKEFNKLIKFN